MQNAADSLGVTLGEDYFVDRDLDAVSLDLSSVDDASRADAFREELLTYIKAFRTSAGIGVERDC